MGSFLASNLLELKNGECKLLLERLSACEKLFYKYAPFAFQNAEHKSIMVSEQSILINNNPSKQTNFQSGNQPHPPPLLPQISIQQSSPLASSALWRKEIQNISILSSISTRNLQKSKFYCCDEIDPVLSKNDIHQQSQSISTNETHDRLLNSSVAWDIKDSHHDLGQVKVVATLPHIVEESEMGVSKFLAPPLLLNREKSCTFSDDIKQRDRLQNQENPIRTKHLSFTTHPFTTHLKKLIFSAVRFIITKTGSLLHYQKMQTYFFREEEAIKPKQNMTILHMQHKKGTFLEAVTCELSNQDSLSSSCMSPISSSSQGLSPSFMNSPMSTSSSNGNMGRKVKDGAFNAGIFYQKVNEDNDVNDLEYRNLISILRKMRTLETDPSAAQSKQARLFFYFIKQRLLDSVPIFLEKRSFLLGRFLVWKMKRWYTLYKRALTESKKMNLYVNQFLEQVCRICDEKVALKDYKYHSQFCKEREEISKDLKANLKTINTELFYFLQKSRSLSVKCQLIQKKIEKIMKISRDKNSSGKMSQSAQVIGPPTRIQPVSRKSTGEIEELRLKKLQDNKTNGQHQFKEYLVQQRSKSILSPIIDSALFEGKSEDDEDLNSSSSHSRISEDSNSDSNSSDSDSSRKQTNNKNKNKHIKSKLPKVPAKNLKPLLSAEKLEKLHRKVSKKKRDFRDNQHPKVPSQQLGLSLLDGAISKTVDITKSIDFSHDEIHLGPKKDSAIELPMISENDNEEDYFSKRLISIELPCGTKIDKTDFGIKQQDLFQNDHSFPPSKSHELLFQVQENRQEEQDYADEQEVKHHSIPHNDIMNESLGEFSKLFEMEQMHREEEAKRKERSKKNHQNYPNTPPLLSGNQTKHAIKDKLFEESRIAESKEASPILEKSIQIDKLSRVSSSETAKRLKVAQLAEDLAEKGRILDRNLKKAEYSSDLESQASSTSLRLMSSSKDMNTMSNSVRMNLSRMASQEVNSLASPFRFKQPEVQISENHKSSPIIENNNKDIQDKQIFNFSGFHHQQQNESLNDIAQKNSPKQQSVSGNHIPDHSLPQDIHKKHRQSYPASQRLRSHEVITMSPSRKLRNLAETPPYGLSNQTNNNSSSPSSSNSLSGDQKCFNSVSYTQFMDSSLKEDESIKSKMKRIGQTFKTQKLTQVVNSSPNMKQSSVQDQQMQQEVQKLSINFELKIQQHQLKSNHLCLRIADLIQYLSKMFFIQDFTNNCKRKRIILDDNKQKIEFLLNKSMIPKDFASKIIDILRIFSVRVELLEKLQEVEKQLKNQYCDINEEQEKQQDETISNESESQKNLSSKLMSNQRIPFKRNGIRSGTQVSNNTAGSRDSPQNFSERQSESKILGNRSQISQQLIRDNNLIIEGSSSLQNYIGTFGSIKQNSSSNLRKNNYDLASQISPVRKVIKHWQMSESSLATGEYNQIDVSQNNLSKEQGSEENSSLNPLISRIQRQQDQNEQQSRKQFIEEIVESRKKFDEILKQAMQKLEDQMMETDDKPSFHSGYYSDGTIDKCYECLETISKKECTSTNICDFEFLKLISKGAFGRVWLVKKKNTDNFYAMKIVNLAEKMNKNNLLSLQNERDIFGIVSGDFVVKAVYTFAHESYLCFVMEYMIGGDLGAIMQQYGVLDQQIARFYIAEIILAVSQLHKAGIVHRDLKPDNLLLDSKGHLKLTDFGLSDMGMKNRNIDSRKAKKIKQEFNNLKRGMDKIKDRLFPGQTPRTKSEQTLELRQIKCNLDVMLNKGVINNDKTKDSSSNQQQYQSAQQQKKCRIIGTPDYIPPEVIKGSNNLNNPTLDWWSVGIILFEMLIGIPPFNDDTVELIFQNILALKVPWDQIPIGYGEDEVSPEAEDLIKKLMDPNPSTRLGANGVNEIQSHPFFKGFDWANVRKMTAPVVPKVKNILDTSNFEKQIQYADKEKMDPFFGLAKGQDEVNKAKDMLKGYNFQMKRYDILYEENCQQLEEIEKKMKFMEEEIIKDEEELEKLEVEYGTDNDDPQEQQPFSIPRSVLTFQDSESSVANSNTSTSIYAAKFQNNSQDTQNQSSLAHIADHRLASFSHQNTLEEDTLNQSQDHLKQTPNKQD